MRVLLVEDDEDIGDAVRDHVAAAGHAVDWVRSLSDARSHVRTVDYDQVLLDLSLPDGDGLELIPFLRRDRVRDGALAARRCGVVVLTARDRLSERVGGLDAGADDYLVKPFDLDELTARMRALGRRGETLPDRALAVGRLIIDVGARSVSVDGAAVPLTSREWALVERLARRPGSTVSRDEIDGALYDFTREVDPNAIESLVSRVRRKLGRDAIVTVRGLGYRIDAADRPA